MTPNPGSVRLAVVALIAAATTAAAGAQDPAPAPVAPAQVGLGVFEVRVGAGQVEGKVDKVVQKGDVIEKAEAKPAEAPVDRAKPAEVPAGRAEVPANPANPALDPWIQQYMQQLGPAAKGEARVLMAGWSPSPEVRQAINTDCEAAAKQVARQCAEIQTNNRRQAEAESASPRKLLAEASRKVAERRLPPEVLARYHANANARAEALRRTVVTNLVAMIDEGIILSADQRDRLTAALTTKYQDTWGNSLEGLMYGGQFLPQIPDDLIEPILSANQKKAWAQLPKFAGQFWGNFGFGVEQVVEGEMAVEVIAAPAPAPAPAEPAVVPDPAPPPAEPKQ